MQCLNMQLTFGLICQQCLTAVVCSNDAKTCYDWIVHAFAALALLQLHIPIGPILVKFGTIQLLHHFIQMALKIQTAPSLAQHCKHHSTGPQIWVVSSFIFDMVHNLGNGTILQSLLTQKMVTFIGFGFVSNIDLIAADNTTPSSPSCILQQLQQTLDLWDMGLWTSGGALYAKKVNGPFLTSSGEKANGNTNPKKKIPQVPFWWTMSQALGSCLIV